MINKIVYNQTFLKKVYQVIKQLLNYTKL